MLKANLSATDGSTNSLQDDVRTIALHVLMGIGFGLEKDFGTGAATIEAGHSMSFAESLRTILRNIVLAFAFSPKVLVMRFMPRQMQKLGRAIEDFLKYNHDFLDSERRNVASGQQPGQTYLLNAIVRSSNQEPSQTTGRNQSLTNEEIFGNMFIFNLAGHDTTASTLTFAVGFLAIYPEWQDWMREEVDHVLAGQQNDNYDDIYPRLKRCQAVMVGNQESTPTLIALILYLCSLWCLAVRNPSTLRTDPMDRQVHHAPTPNPPAAIRRLWQRTSRVRDSAGYVHLLERPHDTRIHHVLGPRRCHFQTVTLDKDPTRILRRCLESHRQGRACDNAAGPLLPMGHGATILSGHKDGTSGNRGGPEHSFQKRTTTTRVGARVEDRAARFVGWQVGEAAGEGGAGGEVYPDYHDGEAAGGPLAEVGVAGLSVQGVCISHSGYLRYQCQTTAVWMHMRLALEARRRNTGGRLCMHIHSLH